MTSAKPFADWTALTPRARPFFMRELQDAGRTSSPPAGACWASPDEEPRWRTRRRRRTARRSRSGSKDVTTATTLRIGHLLHEASRLPPVPYGFDYSVLPNSPRFSRTTGQSRASTGRARRHPDRDVLRTGCEPVRPDRPGSIVCRQGTGRGKADSRVGRLAKRSRVLRGARAVRCLGPNGDVLAGRLDHSVSCPSLGPFRAHRRNRPGGCQTQLLWAVARNAPAGWPADGNERQPDRSSAGSHRARSGTGVRRQGGPDY